MSRLRTFSLRKPGQFLFQVDLTRQHKLQNSGIQVLVNHWESILYLKDEPMRHSQQAPGEKLRWEAICKTRLFFFETKTRILSPYGAAEIGSGAIDGVEIRPAVSGAPWTSEAALGYVRAVLIQESKQVHGTKFAFLMLRTITASSTQIQ